MRPVLIATDLDGTFLDARAEPHPRNIRAAQRAVEAGIEFVIATGRPRRWLTTLTDLHEVNPLVIANNGSVIARLCDEHPQAMFPIDVELIQQFLAEIPESLAPEFAAEYDDHWGHTPGYPTHPDDIEPYVAPLPELIAHQPICKLLAHTRQANTEEWAAIVKPICGPMECTFSWSAEYGTVEFAAPGISKGAALRKILQDRDIDPQNVAAFGDMTNDLTMLELVGHPYIMAGAHHSLRDRGFTQIGHHDDAAVADVIEQWL